MENTCEVCGHEMEFMMDFSNAEFSKGGTMTSDFDDVLDTGIDVCGDPDCSSHYEREREEDYRQYLEDNDLED